MWKRLLHVYDTPSERVKTVSGRVDSNSNTVANTNLNSEETTSRVVNDTQADEKSNGDGKGEEEDDLVDYGDDVHLHGHLSTTVTHGDNGDESGNAGGDDVYEDDEAANLILLHAMEEFGGDEDG